MLGLELDRDLILGDGKLDLLQRVEEHTEVEVRVHMPRVDFNRLFVGKHLH